MFVPISNTPRSYAWGSTSAIATLLGRSPSGMPEAELWLGAHPGSPSVILDPSMTGGETSLARWIAADPATALGPYAAAGRLPFLLKVLAAASPLSLQAHPTGAQAAEGFARENAEGVPLDAQERNYKDPFAKPELIYALSPDFDALCGFRSVDSAREIVVALLDADSRREHPQPQPLDDLLASLTTDDAPRTTVEWLLLNGPGVPALVSLVTELAPLVAGWELEMATVVSLAAAYPGDSGIVTSLLLNRVRMRAGEALYLPAGNIHAYLGGLGIELMEASDNVLRGGLTPKHVDARELLKVLDFRAVPVPFLHARRSEGVELFQPEGQPFALIRSEGRGSCSLSGPAIALCTEGSIHIGGQLAASTVSKGQSVYVTPEESTLTFSGNGVLFVATTS